MLSLLSRLLNREEAELRVAYHRPFSALSVEPSAESLPSSGVSEWCLVLSVLSLLSRLLNQWLTRRWRTGIVHFQCSLC